MNESDGVIRLGTEVFTPFVADIHPKSIKPRVRGKADFFSWQLYRWVLKHPQSLQVWLGTWNPANGRDRDHPVLYIGQMDFVSESERWFHGRMLRNLCRSGENLEGFAYGPCHDTLNWTEVTENWWHQYMEIGVCAIHGDWAHDWVEDGDTRTCQHCGKVEHRRVEMVEQVSWRAPEPDDHHQRFLNALKAPEVDRFNLYVPETH